MGDIPGRLAHADPEVDSRAGRIFSLAAPTPPTGNPRPWPCGVFVESLLAVPQADHGTGRPIAYDVTLREFLACFWPDRTPSPSEYWPQLQYAREALHKCLIPLVAPDAGGVA